MRFVIGLPTDDVHKHDEFGTAEAVTEMARSAEDLGYEAQQRDNWYRLAK